MSNILKWIHSIKANSGKFTVQWACTFLICMMAILIMTPLQYSQGYVMMFGCGLLVLFCLLDRLIYQELIPFIVWSFFFLLYLVMQISSGGILNIKNAAVMFISLSAVYFLSKKHSELKVKGYLFDVITMILILFLVYELVYFAIVNFNQWEVRLSLENQTFPFGWNHVDVSIITACVFMIGMKRRLFIPSFLLAVLAAVILPARTWMLFIILFAVCYAFRKPIYKIMQWKFLKSTFVLFLILILAVTVFGWIWLNILPNYMEVVDGHQGMYDSSNTERFVTILQAVEIIWKEHLFITGVDLVHMYQPLLQKYGELNMLGPHNSYLSVLLYYSITFGGGYLYFFAKVIDSVKTKEMVPYIYPYLLCGCILHDNFIGLRFLLFALVLLVPFKEHKKMRHVKKYRYLKGI